MNDINRNSNEHSTERKTAEPILRRLFEIGQGEIILNQAIQSLPENPVANDLPSSQAGRVAMELVDQEPVEVESIKSDEAEAISENQTVDPMLNENVIDMDQRRRILDARNHVENSREAA